MDKIDKIGTICVLTFLIGFILIPMIVFNINRDHELNEICVNNGYEEMTDKDTRYVNREVKKIECDYSKIFDVIQVCSYDKFEECISKKYEINIKDKQ